ncbi:MAG: cadmium-translocating P-type ATPase [Alphaproteobacteria bacterium]|nr:cadmium-translocating P-type ATPase [Alphaproteobacteria bacterium]
MTAATFSQALNIDPAPFVRRDAKGASRLELAVKGMRCAGCIAKIERGINALPGVEDARVNLSTAKLSVRWREGRTSAAAIVARVNELGFEAFPYDPDSLLRHDEDEGRFLLRCLAVAGFAASNVMFLSICIWAGLDGEMGEGTRTLFHWLSGLIAIPAALYAGRPFFRSAFASLAVGRANMDVPITLGILLALGLSVAEALQGGRYAYFDAAVSLPFLLLIGRYLDHVLRRKARAAALDLAAMQTVTATRIQGDGRTETVAARDIAPGDRLLLAAGDRAPVDVVVETGASEADVSLVTGESLPVAVKPGEALRAGSVVLGQSLTVKATARVQDSLVAEMARLLEAGQQTRGRYVRWADRASALYVPTVHGLALAVLIGGMSFGLEFSVALTNAIALLIITCPCALGLAVPAVQIVATSRLFRAGLLVKSGDALERLAEADVAVFDKTGTLTFGHPVLKNAAAIPSTKLALAASLARASKHPLSRALAVAFGSGSVAADVRETPGEGLEAQVDGARIRLGRTEWIGAAPGPDSQELVSNDSHLWLREGDAVPVRFDFEDQLRPDAADVVAAIGRRGLRVEMLSGDRQAPARAAAERAGISNWHAANDPKQKAEYLETLRAQGLRVLMVGDGLNDAAALALAHVSISPGTAADASQSAADMILQSDALTPIVEAIDIARAARRLVFQNFAFAAVYNALAVPLAAFGLVTPLIAAVAMSASSLIVMLNALRLSRRG